MQPTFLLALAGFLSLQAFVAATPIESEETLVLRSLDPRAQSCKVYTDCARCKSGYWRCCFAGCRGQLPQGGQQCTCVQDGHDLGASCGCT
ncbi:hypothetical protein PG989_001384 [Apiospora arundinis]